MKEEGLGLPQCSYPAEKLVIIREILSEPDWLTYLQLVDGGPVLAGLLHVQLGLDLLGVIYQALADWSLGLQVLVSLPHQGLLLDLTLNLEMNFSHLL